MENLELHLARGDAAAELRKSDAFIAVTNELVSHYVAEIVSSNQDATKERERSYAHIKAVHDIVGMLTQWESIAQQIRTAAEEQANDEDEL